nr:hypothetical protein BaRGS_022992 [Batillaria attramentaria]
MADTRGEDFSLRELQNAALEEARRLRVLLRAPNNASLPKVATSSCPRLWTGDVDAEYLHKAESFRRNNTRRSRDVVDDTLNCTSYVLNNGFRLASVSEEELSFPLAFSVLVYKEIAQVERLLRLIYRPHNVYCVHVDRTSEEPFQSSLRLIELECMRRLWSHAARWRYFINLTGQEFPLKTNKEMVTILKALKGANDITGTHDSGKFVRWLCHFGVGDLPGLTLAPHLIANKFSYDFQPLAYDCLEEWYFHKVHLENSGRPPFLNVSLYKNSDMVRNVYTGPVQIW